MKAFNVVSFLSSGKMHVRAMVAMEMIMGLSNLWVAACKTDANDVITPLCTELVDSVRNTATCLQNVYSVRRPILLLTIIIVFINNNKKNDNNNNSNISNYKSNSNSNNISNSGNNNYGSQMVFSQWFFNLRGDQPVHKWCGERSLNIQPDAEPIRN